MSVMEGDRKVTSVSGEVVSGRVAHPTGPPPVRRWRDVGDNDHNRIPNDLMRKITKMP